MTLESKVNSHDKLTVGELKQIINGLDDDCLLSFMCNDSEVKYINHKVWDRKKNGDVKEFILSFYDEENLE